MAVAFGFVGVCWRSLMVTAKLIGVQDLDRMTTAKINDEMQVIGSR